MDCENNTEMKNNMNNTSMDIMKKMKRVVDLQKEVIDLQEEEINDFNEKKRKIIESFNNLDSLENLYEKDLNEKVEKHKYRVKAYNQFIFKHGMQEFTNMLIKAHDNSEYLQNFREFINFCDEEAPTLLPGTFACGRWKSRRAAAIFHRGSQRRSGLVEPGC